MVIVDEGQRCVCAYFIVFRCANLSAVKNDNSQIFKQLKQLNSVHRILMTGTPINNNIREIFNLMNYLDPENWNNLDAMEEQYAELTEELVKELHERLRPYFLRRVKEDVMKDLPRKVCFDYCRHEMIVTLCYHLQHQIIVPINMTTLQAEVWKSLLSASLLLLGPCSLLSASAIARNLGTLDVLARNARGREGAKLKGRTHMNMANVLMQLRK